MAPSIHCHERLAVAMLGAVLLWTMPDPRIVMVDSTFACSTLAAERIRPARAVSCATEESPTAGIVVEESEGNHMRAVFEEFDEACGENPFYPAWDFCFPDTEAVVAALSDAATQDFAGDDFLGDVHFVFQHFHKWPSSWHGIAQLLDLSQPWTQAYCDKVIASESWSPFLYFSPNLQALSPLMQLTLSEALESPPGALLERYFSELGRSDDPETVRLWGAFVEKDQESRRERTVKAGPLEALLQHEMSKVVGHVLTVCGPAVAGSVLDRRDSIGQTLLHHAASEGNAALAEVLIRSKPEGQRTEFIDALDRDGYSALHVARSGGYSAIESLICTIAGQSSHTRDVQPLSLFNAPDGRLSRSSNRGGWDCSDAAGAVPIEWLPDTGTGQAIDSIDVSQFDWTVFEHHYVRHGRPLLVRGGAEMDTSVARLYSRQGLLEIAGDRQVKTFDFPYADAVGLQEPVVKSIHDYVRFLDERLTRDPAKELSYVFLGIPPDDEMLGFACSLPLLLEGRVQQLRTQFCVGGVLMGSPLHYHVHAANSLMHGRKLWLLMPPAQREFRKTRVFDDLTHSGGSPGVPRLVQEAGDLLYVPKAWNHAAMCLSHCIGVAHEFDLPDASSPDLH